MANSAVRFAQSSVLVAIQTGSRPAGAAHPLHETVHATVSAHGTIVEAIAASQAQHAELVAAGRETEAADVAETLELLADHEATFPPNAVHSRRDRNEP